MESIQLLLTKLSILLIGLSLASAATYPVVPTSTTQTPSTASFFARNPQLKAVAACESTGNPNGTPRQFKPDGSVLWGNDPTTGKPIERDCGEFQVNTWAHAAELKSLGLDVCHSEADNQAYAMILYRRNGLSDWSDSEGCWK